MMFFLRGLSQKNEMSLLIQMENNYYILFHITDFCVHGNLTFKGHCPFAMAVPLIRCTMCTEGNSDSESFIEGSNSMNHASTSFSASQGDISDYAEPQESDNEMLSNEIDSRINKLKNYQAQIDIQLKHLISLS